MKNNSGPRISAVDLFCGVGGLTHGLRHAGIDVRAGYDVDPACRYPYEMNNKAAFHEADVSTLSGQRYSSILEQRGFLFACRLCALPAVLDLQS